MNRPRGVLVGGLVALAVLALVGAVVAAKRVRTRPEPPLTTVRSMTVEEASVLIEAVGDRAPALLRATPTSWMAWVQSRAASINARLDRGEEDSVINLMLYGTGFTRLPR